MSINPVSFINNNTVRRNINNNSNNSNNNNNQLQMNSLKTKSGERTKSAPNNRTRYDNYDTTSSILSDYEEMDFVDIEQSLYVLFNPVRSIQTRNTSDILSLTNTATHTYSSDLELEEGDEEEGEDKEEEHTEIKGQEEENDEEEEEE